MREKKTRFIAIYESVMCIEYILPINKLVAAIDNSLVNTAATSPVNPPPLLSFPYAIPRITHSLSTHTIFLLHLLSRQQCFS
jgi:hypothetical protein